MREIDPEWFDALEDKDRTFTARKKPVEIDVFGPLDAQVRIETREGTLLGEPGDYVIRGVEGEIYPIDPEIFNETYIVSDPDRDRREVPA